MRIDAPAPSLVEPRASREKSLDIEVLTPGTRAEINGLFKHVSVEMLCHRGTFLVASCTEQFLVLQTTVMVILANTLDEVRLKSTIFSLASRGSRWWWSEYFYGGIREVQCPSDQRSSVLVQTASVGVTFVHLQRKVSF